jgi:anti-anti-sigma regulatory factor
MMGFCFVLEQKGELDVYSASSLKQQSTDRHTLDDELRFVLDQPAELDVYIASSLKQQSTDRHTLDDGLLFCSRPTR